MTFEQFKELSEEYGLEKIADDCYGYLGMIYAQWCGQAKVIPLKDLEHYLVINGKFQYFGPFQWHPKFVVKNKPVQFKNHLIKLSDWYKNLPKS